MTNRSCQRRQRHSPGWFCCKPPLTGRLYYLRAQLEELAGKWNGGDASMSHAASTHHSHTSRNPNCRAVSNGLDLRKRTGRNLVCSSVRLSVTSCAGCSRSLPFNKMRKLPIRPFGHN